MEKDKLPYVESRIYDFWFNFAVVGVLAVISLTYAVVTKATFIQGLIYVSLPLLSELILFIWCLFWWWIATKKRKRICQNGKRILAYVVKKDEKRYAPYAFTRYYRLTIRYIWNGEKRYWKSPIYCRENLRRLLDGRHNECYIYVYRDKVCIDIEQSDEIVKEKKRKNKWKESTRK